LDAGTLALVQNFDHILYMSCNPTTLLNNLKVLTKTHTITAMALFDQFPYTPHREVGVKLSRH
jgi:tRNA (uracil-5-)-methyltransferase